MVRVRSMVVRRVGVTLVGGLSIWFGCGIRWWWADGRGPRSTADARIPPAFSLDQVPGLVNQHKIPLLSALRWGAGGAVRVGDQHGAVEGGQVQARGRQPVHRLVAGPLGVG